MSRRVWFLTGLLALAAPFVFAAPAGAAKTPPQSLGPNVLVFDPSMPTSQIQATVDADRGPAGLEPVRDAALRAAVQARHLRHRDAPAQLPGRLLHRASPASARRPSDVVINGSVYVRNQCAQRQLHRAEQLLALAVEPDDQRRPHPDFGCYSGEFWAVSQAAPMRRVHVNGLTTLMDYCTGPSFASGGFIADSQFDGSTVINGSQQQWIVQEQHARRLDQRRLEPGVLRRRGRAGAVLPGAADRAAARTPRSRRAR